MSGKSNGKAPVRVVIVNKSDSTGGAAVVSRRLMEAMRSRGVDARMLVVEKLTDSPYVEVAASRWAIRRSFLTERLGIFLRNGFSRETLFKIDTAACGLPLWRHPLVRNADIVLLNWVNQGMLSLGGVRRILALGKKVAWTMHDMWCMTGVCHHAGKCEGFHGECGCCPLLGSLKSPSDISHSTWKRKRTLSGEDNRITYVAVSNWLAGKARESALLSGERVEVIPNVFPEVGGSHRVGGDGKIRILFGAARLDDPIKGLPVLVAMTRVLGRDRPDLAARLELVTFGGVRNPGSMAGIAIPHRHLGVVSGDGEVRKVYEGCDILVSASSYETLPGTLVEAQAYGCIPVSFNRGGQPDIVSHLSTGYLAEYSPDVETAARALAEGVAWASTVAGDAEASRLIRERMLRNVDEKFSVGSVTDAYLGLWK